MSETNQTEITGQPVDVAYVPNPGKADGAPGTGSNLVLVDDQGINVVYVPDPGKADSES